MSEEIRSFLLGTITVDVMALVALALTLSRGGGRSSTVERRTVVLFTGAGIVVQVGHMLEEWATGFYERFPAFLGLHPWSEELWLGFNLAWIGLWLASLPGVLVGLRAALFPIWVLAIASAVNCVAHPLLSMAVGGYFPGLWTSPACGVVGVVMLRALGRFTDPGRGEASAT